MDACTMHKISVNNATQQPAVYLIVDDKHTICRKSLCLEIFMLKYFLSSWLIVICIYTGFI